MKTKNFVLAIIILLTGNVMFAQKVEVNTKKSTIDWHGEKVLGEHEGNIQVKSGYIELKNDQIVAGNFVIDMTTITNTDLEDEGYNQKLVGHLKSDDFFGVEKFPTANFVVTKSSKFTNGKATITGDITIKGKTESISFEVVRAGNEYTGKIDIDRSKFDVRYGSDSFFDNLGDKVIDDIFTLNIKLLVD
jgi:polyisoprenoid-binding protein YceI